ncbi:MAG: hypothetical protein AAGI90_04985 [Chlamydiota bacterium]
MSKEEKTLSLKIATLFIVGSVFCTLGLGLFFQKKVFDLRKKRALSSKYSITKILQTGSQKNALSSNYLAERLGLSKNCPQNLQQYSVTKSLEALKKSPLIREAHLSKKWPNALYIDYEVREPVVKIVDFHNTVMDEERYLFPWQPYFPAKNLTEVYLGLEGFSSEKTGERWACFEKPLGAKEAFLALDIFHLLQEKGGSFFVKRIDVSRAFAKSFGKQEIVLLIEESLSLGKRRYFFPKILRFSRKNFAKQLGNFLVLREKMLQDYKTQLQGQKSSSLSKVFEEQVLDFRIDELAFIQEPKRSQR